MTKTNAQGVLTIGERTYATIQPAPLLLDTVTQWKLWIRNDNEIPRRNLKEVFRLLDFSRTSIELFKKSLEIQAEAERHPPSLDIMPEIVDRVDWGYERELRAALGPGEVLHEYASGQRGAHLAFCVLERADGETFEFRTFCREPSGKGVWLNRPPTPTYRPLYKLSDIEENKRAKVFILPDERAVLAARDDFEADGPNTSFWAFQSGEAVYTCYRGAAETDFSPLKGREVVVTGKAHDCDYPGINVSYFESVEEALALLAKVEEASPHAIAPSSSSYGPIDFKSINEKALEYLPHVLKVLRPDGFIVDGEFVALNPNRDDKTARSFRLNLKNGKWSDFATGDSGGDVISYTAFVLKTPTQADAARKVLEIVSEIEATGRVLPEVREKVQHDEPRKLSFIPKFPASFSARDLRHKALGAPAHYWPYTDKEGNIYHVVCRFDSPAGKEIRRRTYWQDDETGVPFYRFKDGPNPAPLYHLFEICRSPEAPVIVCEGEKAADAAAVVFPGYVTTTSPGGASRAQSADWAFLAGRDVIIAPDADTAGDAYLHEVANQLLALGCQVRVIDARAAAIITPDGEPRDEAPEGWDIADAIEEWHDTEALRLMLMNHISDYDSSAPEGVAPIIDQPATGNSPTEHLTDLGNAHRLVRFCDGNIRYVHAFKAWYIWDGKRWSKDEDGEIHRLAHSTVEQIWKDAHAITDDAQRTALRKFALASEKRAAFENMVALAQNLPGVPLSHSKLDANPYLLGVKNGVVDLKTGRFRPTRREDYITKQANVVFEPSATCPEWEKFQSTIACGDAELVAFKKLAFGASLSGLFIEALFIQHGGGANGKTTEMEALRKIMGDYAGVADANLLMAPHTNGGASPELVRLKGMRFVSVNESDENDTLNDARVKFITSDGAITARDLYQSSIEFLPTHKLFLATNHKPRIKGTDHGIWRRIHYIPYKHTFREGIKVEGWGEKTLLPEAAGILNWLIEGCRDWLSAGRNLNPPKIVTEAAAEYRKEQNTVAQFVTTCCKPDPTNKVSLTITALHNKYQSWMLDEYGRPGVGKTRMKEELKELGYIRLHDTRHNCSVYKGLDWR